MVRELLEVTLSGDLDPLVRKRLAEVAQLVQSYCRLAGLEIAAVERPKTLRCLKTQGGARKCGL